MKKVLTVLFAVMLTLGLMGTASAYEGEIAFQGIPWGSNVDDAVKTLLEKGFINLEWAEYVNQILLPEYGHYITEREQINAEISSEHSEVLVSLQLDHGNLFLADDIKIAGYPVKRLNLTFVMNGEESQLIDVGIELEHENTVDAIADLKQKLTSVYGKSVHAEVLNGVIATDCWTGTDNSTILLSVSEGGGYFTLDYGTLNAANMVTAASESHAKTNTVDATDVEGL